MYEEDKFMKDGFITEYGKKISVSIPCRVLALKKVSHSHVVSCCPVHVALSVSVLLGIA